MTYEEFKTRYTDREKIGEGGFAKVFRVYDKKKHMYFALKVADVSSKHKKFSLRKEVKLANSLERNQNIARYDFCHRFNFFEGQKDYAILRFYEKGNLKKFVNNNSYLTNDDKRLSAKQQENQIRKYKSLLVLGILKGIAFLHENDIVHRDLKAENILIEREDGIYQPKITDFGLSREMLGNSDITNSSIALTPSYAAPEQIEGRKIRSNVDLWAVGVIIYLILTGELPFTSDKPGNTYMEIIKKIINVEIPDRINKIEQPYQSMIRRCLVKDQNTRVQTAEELMAMMEFPTHDSETTVPIGSVSTEKTAEESELSNKNDQSSSGSYKREGESPSYEKNGDTPLPEYKSEDESQTYKRPDLGKTVWQSKPTRPVEPAPEPELKSDSPQGGDRKSSKWWLWLLIPLFLVGGGAATYFLYPDLLDNIVEIFDAGDDNSTTDEFDEINAEIEKNNTNFTKLEKIKKELQEYKESKIYQTDYHPPYLRAKILAYEYQYVDSSEKKAIKTLLLQELNLAAQLAYSSQHSNQMHDDLDRDGPLVFDSVISQEEINNIFQVLN